jgi:hypothetical protein
MDTGTISVTVSSGSLTSASLTLKTVPQQIATVARGAFAANALEGRAGLFTLTQNPGNKNIRVNYRVDIPGIINLSVVSSSGRTIQCMTNKYHKAGTYFIDWNATNKIGVYFIVLKTSTNKMVRKAFVMR